MTIATVNVVDPANPVEVQAWLDSNPTVTISHITMFENIFYIFYQ